MKKNQDDDDEDLNDTNYDEVPVTGLSLAVDQTIHLCIQMII